ncbi:response regulator [Caloramator sp. mosi_1]|uniref:response regulator n=1 Tax=Caloramator sp. mosi_1 TaxID=3023090 RepID=UPI003081DFFC
MKVLIVDDEALIRDSLKLILGLEEDIEIVGTAKNGQEAIEICKKQNVDVVLMDIRMPVMDGVLATKYIKDINRNIKIIILTTFRDDEFIEQAMKNGAEGYILKTQSTDSIIDTIKMVYKGVAVFEGEVLKSISNMLKGKGR